MMDWLSVSALWSGKRLTPVQRIVMELRDGHRMQLTGTFQVAERMLTVAEFDDNGRLVEVIGWPLDALASFTAERADEGEQA